MANITIEGSDKKILFFDGVCNLCNRSVDFFLRRQVHPKIFVAPLQGQTAQKLLSKQEISDLRSLIYYRNGRIYRESSAVLFAAVDLGGVWFLSAGLLIIPSFIRNLFYRLIARNRYHWFGKKESCRLPTPSEEKFFLP